MYSYNHQLNTNLITFIKIMFLLPKRPQNAFISCYFPFGGIKRRHSGHIIFGQISMYRKGCVSGVEKAVSRLFQIRTLSQQTVA